MYTIVFFTKRVDGMSRDEFFQHYRDTHYELAKKLPGLLSYQQAEIDPAGRPWPVAAQLADYDAVSFYTFESRDDAVAAFASPEGVATDADTPLFMEWSSILAAPVAIVGSFEGSAEAARSGS